jgi:hypothetical protein
VDSSELLVARGGLLRNAASLGSALSVTDGWFFDFADIRAAPRLRL